MDSACLCHTTTSLKLFNNGTLQHTNRALVGANSAVLTLTHKDRRTLRTRQGVVRLYQVYYTDGSNYNLVSVPAMAQSGIKIVIGKQEAYIEKGGYRMYLHIVNGLWALPEEHGKLGLACLKIKRGGPASAKIWHRRLGHSSNSKRARMIEEGTVRKEAADYDAMRCRICQLAHTRRRPVPKITERNGRTVVNLDYMSMGGSTKRVGEVGSGPTYSVVKHLRRSKFTQSLVHLQRIQPTHWRSTAYLFSHR